MLTILSIVILIVSVILHEVSHGYMANALGDPTPRLQGRLTLNPLRHVDPLGSIIVPLITSLSGFTFGWAKPVVYNPDNIKNKRLGEFLVALAGPASNLGLALIFGTILRFTGTFTSYAPVLFYIVLINLTLAIFNLIPVPPFDGSKLLFSILPNQYGRTRMMLEQYAPLFVLIIVFVLWKFISPVVPLVFSLFTGVSLY